jgi:hypothetical protein
MTIEQPIPATSVETDPSMEEIIASINRIILRDDDVPAASAQGNTEEKVNYDRLSLALTPLVRIGYKNISRGRARSILMDSVADSPRLFRVAMAVFKFFPLMARSEPISEVAITFGRRLHDEDGFDLHLSIIAAAAAMKVLHDVDLLLNALIADASSHQSGTRPADRAMPPLYSDNTEALFNLADQSDGGNSPIQTDAKAPPHGAMIRVQKVADIVENRVEFSTRRSIKSGDVAAILVNQEPCESPIFGQTWTMELVIGEGDSARGIRIDLPPLLSVYDSPVRPKFFVYTDSNPSMIVYFRDRLFVPDRMPNNATEVEEIVFRVKKATYEEDA